MARPNRAIRYLSIIFLVLVLSGCVKAAAPEPSTSPLLSTPKLEQAQAVPKIEEQSKEEIASQRLKEQNGEYWERVRELLQKTSAGVGSVRELSPPESIPFMVVTADWAHENWGEGYVKGSASKIEIDERVFKGLFILPDPVSLAQLYSEWPRFYIAAALEDKLYFIQDNFGNLNAEEARKTLAHEVVHILQGKHMESAQPATYDEEKAWAALTEGDADFTRTRYLKDVAEAERLPEFRKIPGSTAAPSTELPRPQALTSLLYFPYTYGESFVSMLYQAGGWQAVNRAYKRPPTTTEQVMHPEKYLGGEGPVSLRSMPVDIAGWQEQRSDRLGEYFIKVMLESLLTEGEAGRAAQGWGNDKLTYYENSSGYALVWQTMWDSVQDASEFHEAFLRVLEKAGTTRMGDSLWLAQGKYFSVRNTGGQEVIIVMSGDRSMVESGAKSLSKR